MQKDYKKFQAVGAEVIAISNDDQAETKRTTEQSKARYPVLADPEKGVIAAYNATDPFNPKLARPITYIIDEGGILQWKFLDIRAGHRIDSDKVIDALKKL